MSIWLEDKRFLQFWNAFWAFSDKVNVLLALVRSLRGLAMVLTREPFQV